MPVMFPVQINEKEYQWAGFAGILRRWDALARGQKDRAMFKDTGKAYDADVLGAVGEFVASVALGVCWRGPSDWGQPDLACGYQVRTVTRMTDHLIIRPKSDHPDDIFILVVATENHLKWYVAGWCWGKDALQLADKRDPTKGIQPQPECYMVPQGLLYDIKELMKR